WLRAGQGLQPRDRTKYAPASGVARGGYVLADAGEGQAEIILIGTGSELSLCVAAYEKLTAEGVRARVVSMPSTDIFDQQAQDYKNSVLPPEVGARVSVEAAAVFGWERYVGPSGAIIGMTTFGASGPGKEAMKKFGFTSEHVIATAKEVLARNK